MISRSASFRTVFNGLWLSRFRLANLSTLLNFYPEWREWSVEMKLDFVVTNACTGFSLNYIAIGHISIDHTVLDVHPSSSKNVSIYLIYIHRIRFKLIGSISVIFQIELVSKALCKALCRSFMQRQHMKSFIIWSSYASCMQKPHKAHRWSSLELTGTGASSETVEFNYSITSFSGVEAGLPNRSALLMVREAVECGRARPPNLWSR